MRAFLNMEFYQEGGPGHCYASPATLLEMTLFKKLAHPARPDKTCTRLRTAPRRTYEGDLYREQVVREPTTVVFRNLLSSKEVSVLKGGVVNADGAVVNTSISHTLRELAQRLENVTDLKAIGSKIPWKQLTSYCHEHTWLNPGNNLRSKPFATWWVFSKRGVLGGLERSLLPKVIVNRGTVLLRYHVMSDGTRDREPIPFSCSKGDMVIFYKRIMLEDQRLLCPSGLRWHLRQGRRLKECLLELHYHARELADSGDLGEVFSPCMGMEIVVLPHSVVDQNR
ncbi:hypothetical protein MTO96_028069 [Rhipicephalus appendiculatus]